MNVRAAALMYALLAGCSHAQDQAQDGGPLPADGGPSDGAATVAMGRRFPDTGAVIGILADQLPGGMSDAQQRFVTSHFLGSQKLTLDISRPLRALSPGFLVLHYHLAIWQSAPGVNFIVDGQHWDNDYPMVTQHEGWFWHNQAGQRVASKVDAKLLMNLGDADFQAYWARSLAEQVRAGDYDGIFFDSASPALLQAEAQSPPEPRLQTTGARDTPIAELQGRTYIQAWESFISMLDGELRAQGIPLIPNTGAFVTTWDNTRYDLTAGVFVEGFASPSFSPPDWIASTDEILGLVAGDKIVILQNYLQQPDDLARRRYYLANYLLVKGSHTYLDYFAQGPLEWYPEWGLDLGPPLSSAMKADELLRQGVYQRDFQKGRVLINPSAQPVTVDLGGTFKRVEPQGGGAVPQSGAAPGSLATAQVTSLAIPPFSAEIILK